MQTHQTNHHCKPRCTAGQATPSHARAERRAYPRDPESPGAIQPSYINPNHTASSLSHSRQPETCGGSNPSHSSTAGLPVRGRTSAGPLPREAEPLPIHHGPLASRDLLASRPYLTGGPLTWRLIGVPHLSIIQPPLPAYASTLSCHIPARSCLLLMSS